MATWSSSPTVSQPIVAMKDPALAFLLACALPTAVVAQTVDLAALAPATMTAAYGGSQQITTLPAGPMSLQGYVSAVGGTGSLVAVADLTWSAEAGPGAVDVFLTASAGVPSPGPGAAVSGLTEVLITISYPTAIIASLEMSKVTSSSAGTISPVARIDLFDDGSYEIDETSSAPTVVGVPVGPGGLVISCLLDASTAVEGSVVAGLRVRLLPAETAVHVLFDGCGAAYSVAAGFDGNVEFGVGNVQVGVNLAVFGLSTQPLLLGSQAAYPGGPLLPCVLLPQPDLVLFLPTSAPQTLVIPPAARPVVLYSQCVQFGLPGFATSATFVIAAY